MRLKTITLHDFRCFEHLHLTLHPRLTVLVGENGAGKTALLDGIAAALSPILTYLSSANQRLSGRGIQDSDFRVLPQRQLDAPVRRSLADTTQLTVESHDGLRWDVWRASISSKRPARVMGQAELKHYLQAIVDSYASKSRLTPVIAYYGARRGYIEVPQRLRAAKENYAYPASALIGALDSMSNFREMLAWFDREEAAELRGNKGVTHERYVESPTLAAVRTAIKELLGGAYLDPHFNREHKFVLTRQIDGAQLFVNQLSQGYQSMLALAMDFARRLTIANPEIAQEAVFDARTRLAELDPGFATFTEGERDDVSRQILSLNAPAIMLVDEIDLHLHPTWQQRVLGDLLRTFPLTQFIVTTHSPQVLSTVARDNIRILRITDTGYEAATPEFSPLAHEAGDALVKIMETHREPELPLQDDIRQYEQWVRTGQEEATQAHALKSRLEKAGYQFHESDLFAWRLLARNSARSG